MKHAAEWMLIGMAYSSPDLLAALDPGMFATEAIRGLLVSRPLAVSVQAEEWKRVLASLGIKVAEGEKIRDAMMRTAQEALLEGKLRRHVNSIAMQVMGKTDGRLDQQVIQQAAQMILEVLAAEGGAT